MILLKNTSVVTVIATGFDKEPGTKEASTEKQVAWLKNSRPATPENKDLGDIDIPPFLKRNK